LTNYVYFERDFDHLFVVHANVISVYIKITY